MLEDDVLVLSGGADALFAFPDLDRSDAELLLGAWTSGLVAVDALTPDARETVWRLRDVGALRGEERDVASVRFEVRVVGSPVDGLVDELEHQGYAPTGADPELVVFVRTNAALKESCGPDYASLEAPHLLLDLGFRHTMSLGPLVFPGETACLACLVGRIARYWGDARPPDQPAALRHVPLAAALLALEIERFASGDYRLVNETVSISLDRLETTRSGVYRLPWCPVCRDVVQPVGSIPLPWTAG